MAHHYPQIRTRSCMRADSDLSFYIRLLPNLTSGKAVCILKCAGAEWPYAQTAKSRPECVGSRKVFPQNRLAHNFANTSCRPADFTHETRDVYPITGTLDAPLRRELQRRGVYKKSYNSKVRYLCGKESLCAESNT